MAGTLIVRLKKEIRYTANLTATSTPTDANRIFYNTNSKLQKLRDDIDSHAGGTPHETPAQIRDALETLRDSERLPSTAIDGLLTLPMTLQQVAHFST